MVNINFKPGDVVSVYQRVKEGEKQRTQIFTGTVLAIRGEGINKMFTVRKVSDRIGVERIWPLRSPLLEKIVLKAKPKKRPRRAKLYYLRHV